MYIVLWLAPVTEDTLPLVKLQSVVWLVTQAALPGRPWALAGERGEPSYVLLVRQKCGPSCL